MLVYDGRSGWEVGRAATGEVASGREVVVERQQSLEFRVFGLQWPPALEEEVGGGGSVSSRGKATQECHWSAGVGQPVCGGRRRERGVGRGRRRLWVVGGWHELPTGAEDGRAKDSCRKKMTGSPSRL